MECSRGFKFIEHAPICFWLVSEGVPNLVVFDISKYEPPKPPGYLITMFGKHLKAATA